MPRFITIESMLAEFPENACPTLRTLREDLISRRLAVKIGRSWLTTPEKAKAYFDQIEEEGVARCAGRVTTPPAANGKRKRRPSILSSGRITRANDDAVEAAMRAIREARERQKAARNG